jgi:N-acetylglutamate synthase-like GNAT family acetyltransferase
MSLSIEYRKGSLNDVSKLKFAKGLSVSGESVEFNVVGVGHEFWVAVQSDMIIGIIVLGRGSQNELRIMHLEVAPARKNEGVGSALLRAVIVNYPEYKLSVIPFEGTEDFYSRLGFLKVGRWEMRREPSFFHG